MNLCLCCRFQFTKLNSEELCHNCSFGLERARIYAFRIGVKVNLNSKQVNSIEFVCENGHAHVYKLSATTYWDGECKKCEKDNETRNQDKISAEKKRLQDNMFKTAKDSNESEETPEISPDLTFSHLVKFAAYSIQMQAAAFAEQNPTCSF